MTQFRARRALLVLMLVAATGIFASGIGVGLLIPTVPHSLSDTRQLTAYPVSPRQYSDARNVQVTVTPAQAVTVKTPREGRVTALHIDAGTMLSSGDHVLDIDGLPLHALATAIPLWRDLNSDTKGEDVTSLQAELSRLGYDVTQSGRADWQTRKAAAQLLGIDDGAGGVPETIPVSFFLWIPRYDIIVNGVDTGLGDTLTMGSSIATLDGGSNRVTVDLPAQAYEGQRLLVFGDNRLPLPADGVLTDDTHIAAILSSTHYLGAKAHAASSDTDDVTFPAQWELETPLDAYVVPPAALFGITGNKGCVANNGNALAVTIVASELGQSIILLDTPLDTVDALVEGLTCLSQ